MKGKTATPKVVAAPVPGANPLIRGQKLKAGRHGGRCTQLERNRRHRKHKDREKRRRAGTLGPASIYDTRSPKKSSDKGAASASRPEEKRPYTSSEYWDLHHVRNSRGECYHCGHSPNETTVIQTDVGKKMAVRCGKCGKWMQPY